MNFKYCQIDPNLSSREELKKEINRLKSLKDDNENLQMALKIFINSAYGAIGNQYFQCYNTDVAEAITLQGQNLLQYSMKYLNKYFKEHWHEDVKLHELMKIEVSNQVINDVCVYGDTDSAYVSFDEVISSVSKYNGDKYTPVEFIKMIYNYRLKNYFEIMHEKYSKRWNTTNIQDFELETISYAGIWLAKKKYVLDIAWKEGGESGIYYSEQSKISPKGIEIAQSSYPKFARDTIKELITYIFHEGNNFNLTKFMSKIKTTKERFKLENIENISLLRNINDYNKYVLDDRNGLKLELKCPIHLKAAAVYNYEVNNSKYKNKYNLIKAGNKIKYYYVKNASKDWEVFGFIPNEYPIEIAPDIDYDKMFQKCILDPINRFMEALGHTSIPTNLVFIRALW